METYIATFFSHFGAVRFGRQLREAGIDCALMPVPRQVSSSCGTCVRFTAKPPPPLPAEGGLGVPVLSGGKQLHGASI